MSHDSKLPKTNRLLPSINYKQLTSLLVLLLVTTSHAQQTPAKYECPGGCECDEATFSAKCSDLDALIASYSRRQQKSRQNFMPIKLLDLSNNQLTKLTSQLELLVNVTELNLSHNQLTQVYKLNFNSLERLNLSHNRITSAKLKKLPKNVIHLDLAHNQITYLPVDFMKLKNLRSLELAGNPLNCTCNTLSVRNWITFKHMWTENLIVCTAPSIVKGQPWLQARQNDICLETSTTTTQRSKYNWDNYEDDNEIMMNDQPDESGDVEYDDEEDDETEKKDDEPASEEKKDVPAASEEATVNDTPADQPDESNAENDDSEDVFGETSEKPEVKVEEKNNDDDLDYDDDLIPVSREPSPNESSTVEPEAVSKIVTDLGSDYEGSGADSLLSVPSEAPEDDTDESGSGGGIFIPGGDSDDATTEADVGLPTLGIFEDSDAAAIEVHKAPVGGADSDTENIDPSIAAGAQGSGDIKKASTDDNTGTYILLAILALCLISLMIFVAMKNNKEKNRNRRYDVEKNGATELQDMDKRLLGKPLDRNGNGNGKPEQAPLINEHPNERQTVPSMLSSFHPPEITIDEPKAAARDKNKSQQSLYENLPNGNGHVEPVHQSPTNGSVHKAPESEDELYLPAVESPESLNVSPEPPKRYSPIYTPASPRSERYSPVYSPETGRVKIKLTETPKPKTPVVVTRSRSRAGDYINTPNN